MAYDYIIVGTGAAGAALAERLSASGKHSILILEAGGRDWNPMHRIPKGWVFTMQNDKYVKKYEPEPFGDNTVEVWPRGIINGGSTTVNGLGWNTGEAPGYDWESRGTPAGTGNDSGLRSTRSKTAGQVWRPATRSMAG